MFQLLIEEPRAIITEYQNQVTVEVQVTVSGGELSSSLVISFTVTNREEVIIIIPTKSDSGGSVTWLLLLMFIGSYMLRKRKLA